MLDVAGQDATEAFEDVGHSDEAREILARAEKMQAEGTIGQSTGGQGEALSPVEAADQGKQTGLAGVRSADTPADQQVAPPAPPALLSRGRPGGVNQRLPPRVS